MFGRSSSGLPSNGNKETEWVTPFRVLLLMSGMFFLIYLDRGTIASNAVNGSEKDDSSQADGMASESESKSDDKSGSGFQGEFGLKNSEDGVLSSMFMVGMSVAIPVCSELIYSVNAFRLAGVGLLIWTVSTICCGFSFDFYSLALCRTFVGVGEAAVISLAPPYIDDNAPPERKTAWLACLFVAVPLGYAAGYGYGSAVGGNLGWRFAFIIEGLLMAPFVLFCFSAKPLHLNMKTVSGAEESRQDSHENRLQTFWRHTKEVMAHRVYPCLLVGYVCCTLFIGVLAYWGAKAAKAVYDLDDMVTGGMAAGMGLVGAASGGWVLDRMGSSIPKALAMSSLCCFLPACLASIGFHFRPSLPFFLPIFAFILLLIFSLQAPVQAAVLWCVPPNHRTLANGLSVLVIHLFGDVPGPPLFGHLVDRFKHRHHMAEDDAYSKALALTSLVLFIAALFFAWAAWLGRSARDYRSLNAAPAASNDADGAAPHVPLLQ